MTVPIDDMLIAAFTVERVKAAFYDYKYAKWDHFSDTAEPSILIPMGVDGVSFEAFERQLERHARNISRRVSEGNYLFQPFREVEIEKEPATQDKPAKYRTLSIASVRDALVQSILYREVLYDPLEALFSALDNPSPVSFAYRKGKSAPDAALAVFKYAQSGYWHVLDADLSKYFDTIPHNRLMSRLESFVDGISSKTYRLLYRFVHSDRVPYNSYRWRKGKHKVFQWSKPYRVRREKGVPQGGVLSGMLANLYLHDFDSWIVTQLATKIDLKYVRYADDFIVMARDSESLIVIQEKSKEQIDNLCLNLNDEKTDRIDIRSDGLDFVGFHFDEHDIRIRQRNIERYQERVKAVIREDKERYGIQPVNEIQTARRLSRLIAYKIQGLSGQEWCPRCGQARIGKPRSWMAFFQVVTDDYQLRILDKWTRSITYQHVYELHRTRKKRKDLRKVGFRSLVNEKYRINKIRLKPCLCDLDNHGLEPFLSDLFVGKTFSTLQQRRQFSIKEGVSGNLQLTTANGRKYPIAKQTLLELWMQLKESGQLSRVAIENSGIGNASHIIAMLAELPSVEIMVRPTIRVFYRGPRIAPFLQNVRFEE